MGDTKYRIPSDWLRSWIVGDVIVICLCVCGATAFTMMMVAALASWVRHDLWAMFLFMALTCLAALLYLVAGFRADLNTLVEIALGDVSRPVPPAAKEEPHAVS